MVTIPDCGGASLAVGRTGTAAPQLEQKRA